MKRIIALMLALIAAVCFSSCDRGAPEGIWENATYLEDTTLGEGAKTVTVKVTVEEKAVVFTVKTDAETLGEALKAHRLIDGDEGEFGLYLKVVNGMTADYDIDRSYWEFTAKGEYMMTGVDGTAISDGDAYELTYKK